MGEVYRARDAGKRDALAHSHSYAHGSAMGPHDGERGPSTNGPDARIPV